MKVSLECIAVCLYCVSLCSGLSSSVRVHIHMVPEGVSENQLPDVIDMTLGTDSGAPIRFHLRRAQHTGVDVPVYAANADTRGQLTFKRENTITRETTAFYHDSSKQAVMHIRRHKTFSGKSTHYSVVRGEYSEDNVRYSVEPQVMDMTQFHHVSNQDYIILPMTSTPVATLDLLRPAAPNDHDIRRPTYNHMDEPFRDEAANSRRKRQSTGNYCIDVVAYVDYSFYTKWISQYSSVLEPITEYFSFIFNWIDQVYQNFEGSNFKLRVRLSKLVVFQSASVFALTDMGPGRCDAESTLWNFREFLNTSKGLSLSQYYDHAMLFTGTDLWINQSDVTGFSFLKSLCKTDFSSSSIIEDKGDYSSYLSAARELGRSMSAEYDGVGNQCNASDRYLISSAQLVHTNVSGVNPWRFSSCSKQYISSYITELMTTQSGQLCLSYTLPVEGNFFDVRQRLLGQEILPWKQCQLKHGDTSYACAVTVPSDVCRMLSCYNKSMSQCVDQFTLIGTDCGSGMVCKFGECINQMLAVNELDNWSSWPLWMTTQAPVSSTVGITNPASACVDDQQCSFIMNSMNSTENQCYENRIQALCCSSCSLKATNITNCEFGDRDSSLCTSISSCKDYPLGCCQTCFRASHSVRHHGDIILVTLMAFTVSYILLMLI